MKPKILLVEDDDGNRQAYVAMLARDYVCIEARNGEEGRKLAIEYAPDLVITDVSMPELSGPDLCKWLKQTPELAGIPVIICTSYFKRNVDMEFGYNAGAIDYMIKPIDRGVLLAKVRSILQQCGRISSSDLKIEVDGMAIDSSRRIVSIDGEPLDLTRKEFDLLVALVSSDGRVQSVAQLMERVWGDALTDKDTNTVKTQISTLRKKLGPKVGARIINVSGLGYRFD